MLDRRVLMVRGSGRGVQVNVKKVVSSSHMATRRGRCGRWRSKWGKGFRCPVRRQVVVEDGQGCAISPCPLSVFRDELW